MIITHAYLSYFVTAIPISMENAWLNKEWWNGDKEPMQGHLPTRLILRILLVIKKQKKPLEMAKQWE